MTLVANIRRVTCVGGGLIGSRWAAQFLAAGLDVTVVDTAPDAEERIAADITAAWPAMQGLGFTDLQSPPRVAFSRDLAEGVGQAEFIQENVPDFLEVKHAVLKQIDAACPPEAIIASSTSTHMPSVLQSVCAHPERLIVGHPFNPAHILPLVEVVGGERTSAEVIVRAMRFYADIGKEPLHCRKEASGFIGCRLQEALYREMFHMVNDGLATTEELDAAIINGPGPRWALYGPALVYMMSGGQGGFAYALEQFDPVAIAGDSHNYYPEITPELKQELDAQTREQAKGRSLEQLEALRDEFLIRLINLRHEMTGQ
jgi:carnitine 3-dehydrogenase